MQSLRLLQVDGTLSDTRPSILLTGKIPSSVIARLEHVGDVDRFQRDGVDVMPHDELVARVAGKQAIVSMITDAIDRQVIEAGIALKVIANAAVGYNNIDVAAARERGIIVTNTPGVLTDATADLTWALILGITRRIGEGERLIRRGEWRGWTFDFMLGAELRGKQLGIVGYGGIGRAVAARGRVFGMRIAYTSRTPKNDPDAEAMNAYRKYVVSTTLERADWANSSLIRGNVVEEVTKLKQQEGQDIGMSGSSTLVQSLLRHKLIDELNLLIYPVVLGRGKRLYEDRLNLNLKLTQSTTSSSGVLLTTYQVA